MTEAEVESGEEADSPTAFMSPVPLAMVRDDRIDPNDKDDDRPEPDASSHRLDVPKIDDSKSSKSRRRFSMLRFRNASDSQLSIPVKQDDEKSPPTVPPLIANTSATGIGPSPPSPDPPAAMRKKKSRASLRFAAKLRRPTLPLTSSASVDDLRPPVKPVQPSGLPSSSLESPPGQPVPAGEASDLFRSPPAYGDHEASLLALPTSRVSESSRSDASSAIYASTTTTTTQTVHTTTTFFRLAHRRKKPQESLFPISHLPRQSMLSGSRGKVGPSNLSLHPPSSSAGPSSSSSQLTLPITPTLLDPFDRPVSRSLGLPSAPGDTLALASAHATPISDARITAQPSSLGLDEAADDHAPPATRSSSSTAAGRRSFGDLLGFGKLRQHYDGTRSGISTPVMPGSRTPKNNSLQFTRETAFVLPDRLDDETPAKYLARLEEVVSRGMVATLLSRRSDPFTVAALRSYMRSFSFFGEPMDMAIRKLLMEVELPKETQEIDRTLQAFADRYDECNPRIYTSPEQAYFIAFSLLILHTDIYNKNNKHKMQKADYLKNTSDEAIADEILECFYDNISYTPFIRLEDDLDINGERIVAHKSRAKRPFFSTRESDSPRHTSKELLDPYNPLIEGKLSELRPNLKEIMCLDDPYSYLGTATGLNVRDLQKTFFRTGVLQIISARSRPDAFMSEKTATNPDESHPGIVDIKITKVGLLWRKDAKKKKTRSPWQEWGAILTGAQLYFFRNMTWAKSLMAQYESHIRQGLDGVPIVFKPPLEQFKPDALISTDGAVALVDATYKKHKHGFVYVRRGGFEEVLLAESEEERNDWLAKLNYAAAFRTSGVRMRGVVGGNYDGQSRRPIRRLDNPDHLHAHVVQTPTGDVTIARGHIDYQMAEDILSARREIMLQKVSDADRRIAETERQLDVLLQNSRHLQILAPVQAKTREQVVLAAGRMAAKLKYLRIEMWRLRCHRDVLVEDLAEERRSAVLPNPASKPSKAIGSSSGSGSSKDTPPQLAHRAENSGFGPAPPSSSPAARQRLLPYEEDGGDDSGSLIAPDAEVTDRPLASSHNKAATSTLSSASSRFSTIPPSTVTAAATHRHARSISQARSDHESMTNDSVTTATASYPPSPLAPSSMSRPATWTTDDGAPLTANQPIPVFVVPVQVRHDVGYDDDEDVDEDVDVDEQNLLRQVGLIDITPSISWERLSGSPGDAAADTVADSRDAPEDASDRQDRRKLRRGLQRTFQGASHLSPNRPSRRGRDDNGAGGGGSGPSADDAVHDETLIRASGSFVVHGKKASVVNFGPDFHGLAADENLLRLPRRSPTAAPPIAGAAAVGANPHDDRMLRLLPPPAFVCRPGSDHGNNTASGSSGRNNNDNSNNSHNSHNNAPASAAPQPSADDPPPSSEPQVWSRRESAGSSDTATARSFRQLHRRYSSVQAQRLAVHVGGGGLAIPSDDDSDAAVSFSEGWHTPLQADDGAVPVSPVAKAGAKAES